MSDYFPFPPALIRPYGLIYLASPYTDCDEAVQHSRYVHTAQATGRLIRRGHMVFSPIIHSLPLVDHASFGSTWEDWRTYDEKMIDFCDTVAVLLLPGWEYSIGVRGEVEYVLERGKPLVAVTPGDARFVTFVLPLAWWS